MTNSAFQRMAVIGQGRFGVALAKQLAIHGTDLIAIDSAQGLVDEVQDDVSFAVRLNSTNKAALRSQEVDICRPHPNFSADPSRNANCEHAGR